MRERNGQDGYKAKRAGAERQLELWQRPGERELERRGQPQ